MVPDADFTPMHINATAEDFLGNNGIGRYILLPGSDGRAHDIAQHFDNLTVKKHPRAHNLYCGTLSSHGQTIDVATVSAGMGCPSMEIILHELYHLGAKRFLRIGTAGSLQPEDVKIGHLVNAMGAVRDESTTSHYVPLEFPAIASYDMIGAIHLAAQKLNLLEQLHQGIVHCKDSLYAREFGAGPRAVENKAYLDLMTRNGVLASEMETATLFIQSHLYNYQSPKEHVLAGAILAIIATPEHVDYSEKATHAIENSILIALETVKILATQ
jgi:uridine phosphorylase